ncbi:hypothetical protein ACWGJX_46100 [Streptomyces sp. NPDC054775]
MTDRRPLGTGPATADLSRTRDTDLPRAQLAAEPGPARRLTGRRALGAGPGTAGL